MNQVNRINRILLKLQTPFIRVCLLFSKKVVFLANWADIRWQISYSNVIQRDNAEFVRRLDRSLVDLAKEKAKEVRQDILK